MTGAGAYAAYGLRIRSEIPLPHFGPAQPGEPDVVVRLGTVPRLLPTPRRTGAHWQAAPGDFLLRVGDELRFRVVGGREVIVDRAGDGGDGLAAAHLVSSVWTALLQQRGFLTLHASAVWTERGAALFLGNSGAGKSTLAAALMARGFGALADDVAAVSISAGAATVAPGYPNLRLSADAFDRLGLSARTARPARDGANKHLLPAERFAREPKMPRAGFVLGRQRSESLAFERLAPTEAFRVLGRLTHRRRYGAGLGTLDGHFNALAALAGSVPVTRVTRPVAGVALSTLADEVERRLS